MSRYGTINREQATWVRGDGQTRITHPYLWLWTEPYGAGRYFDTKAEAVAARADYEREMRSQK